MLRCKNIIFLAFAMLCVCFTDGQLSHKKEALNCPDDSNLICKKIGQKVYLIDGKSNVNWYEADRLCRRYGAQLVTFESEDELNTVSKFLYSNNYDVGDHWFWTGVSDLGSEGTFYAHKTGQVAPYLRWSPGQPDNANNNENCVHLWRHASSFYMNDLGCLDKRHFICEQDNLIFDVRSN